MDILVAERQWIIYRRLTWLRRRKGSVGNPKEVHRLYREGGLAVRRRAVGTCAPIRLPAEPNEHWSLDFLADQHGDAQR